MTAAAACCLNKLEEEGTDRTFYTDVGCRLLDSKTCRCRDYPNRLEKVDDCVRADPAKPQDHHLAAAVVRLRPLVRRQNLYWWHPLVSGDPNSVHAAGVSVRGTGHSERDAGARRRARGLHRQLAAEIAKRSETAEVGQIVCTA